MDFGALPPEVNSGRMYVGPGPATLLAASAGWDALAAELHSAADGYQAAINGLTDDSWTGPSSTSMMSAVAPYLQWMRTAAVQCEEASTRATAAAAAYETALAMTVPPPAIVANRAGLANLVATNSLGQHTPAIAAAEAEYSEMWAQDATAMYNYAASAAAASAVKVFPSPPGMQGLQAMDGSDSTAQTASTRQMSAVTEALQRLAQPGSSPSGTGPIDIAGALDGSDGGASADTGQVIPLGLLSVPLSWADALSMAMPEPVLDANVMPGGWGAMPPVGTRSLARFSKPPLGALEAYGAGRARRRNGLRSSRMRSSSVVG